MSFMYHFITCVAHSGVSIVVVTNYVQILLAICVMKNLLPLTRWPCIGLFRMIRCLVIYANDRIRSVGLIVEIVGIPFNPLFTVFRMKSIVPSVPINACVLMRNARCA